MIEQIVFDGESNILFDCDSDAFDRCHIARMVEEKRKSYSSPVNGDGPPALENLPIGGIDKQDAVQKITDELKRNPLWWPIEFFFTPYTYQNAKGKWVTTWW
jgi:hypothetical protein